MARSEYCNWCAWFAGFCDAEAHFGIDNHGRVSLAIELRDDDEPLLSNICKVFGIGSVYSCSKQYLRDLGQNAQDSSRLRVMGRENCSKVVAILNEAQNGSWYSWFGGFCDGEASFAVHQNGYPTFCISLRDDDLAVLENIRQTLEVGNVRLEKRENKVNNRKNAASYTAEGASKCRLIADALTGRMKSKKSRDFELWSEAIVLANSLPGRANKERKVKMLEYKTKLEEVRRYPV